MVSCPFLSLLSRVYSAQAEQGRRKPGLVHLSKPSSINSFCHRPQHSLGSDRVGNSPPMHTVALCLPEPLCTGLAGPYRPCGRRTRHLAPGRHHCSTRHGSSQERSRSSVCPLTGTCHNLGPQRCRIRSPHELTVNVAFSVFL